MSTTLLSLATSIELDTDAVSPDSLRAAFDIALDALLSRANGHKVAIDWGTIEMRIAPMVGAPGDSSMIVRGAVLR